VPNLQDAREMKVWGQSREPPEDVSQSYVSPLECIALVGCISPRDWRLPGICLARVCQSAYVGLRATPLFFLPTLPNPSGPIHLDLEKQSTDQS